MENFIVCAVILISAILSFFEKLSNKNNASVMEILAATLRTKISSTTNAFINSHSNAYKRDKLSEGSRASKGVYRTLSNIYNDTLCENS